MDYQKPIPPFDALFELTLPVSEGRKVLLDLKKEFPECVLPKDLLRHYGLDRKNKYSISPKKVLGKNGEVLFDPTKGWEEETQMYTFSIFTGDRVRVMASKYQPHMPKFFTGVVVWIGSYKGRARYSIRPDIPNSKIVVRFQTQIELL